MSLNASSSHQHPTTHTPNPRPQDLSFTLPYVSKRPFPIPRTCQRPLLLVHGYSETIKCHLSQSCLLYPPHTITSICRPLLRPLVSAWDPELLQGFRERGGTRSGLDQSVSIFWELPRYCCGDQRMIDFPSRPWTVLFPMYFSVVLYVGQCGKLYFRPLLCSSTRGICTISSDRSY